MGPSPSPLVHPPDSWARLPIPSRRDKAQSLLGPHSLFQQLLGFSARPRGELSSNCSGWKGREHLSMGINKLGLKEAGAGFLP